ncbi:hypothetical protein NSK_007456, partial [Nannochloropsis salina CCMP1776]
MEEDEFAKLLAEQEAFLASKEAPAAKVVRRQVDNAEEAKAARSPNSGPTQPLPAHLSNPMLAVMAGEVVERTSEASCLPLSKHIGRDSRGFPNAVPRMRERPRGSGEGDEGGRRGGSQERRGEGRVSGREGREASRRDVGDKLEEEGREVREQGEISMGMEDEDLARMQAENLSRLAQMTADERQAALEEALTFFSPAGIETLRRHGEKRIPPPLPSAPPPGPPPLPRADGALEALKHLKIDSEDALHAAIETLLDKEERAKLAWTEGGKEGGTEGGEEDGVVRVDFDGHVVKKGAKETLPTHSGLYHNPEQ